MTQVKDGRIFNSATEELEKIRRERSENLQELSRTAEEWARKLHASGASERPIVVIRRDRRCIPVRSGRNGDLPKESVTLGTSSSGSTMYIEPAPIVPLNNTEIALSSKESEEEKAILENLSKLVAAMAGSLRHSTAAVTRVDIAFARAKYAAWLGGVAPDLLPSIDSASRRVHIPGVVHPILVEPYLAPLPAPRLPQAASASPLDTGLNSLSDINLIPEIWNRDIDERKKIDSKGDVALNKTNDIEEDINYITVPPVPIDIIVPQGKSAVIMTGPNTGGKTASMKTFGLCALMAKAGLFIPCPQIDTGEDGNVVVPWFDKVLADIGDGQSLQQNLSTFSGHVRRLKGVLKESNGSSLVLLDEIGSGTDPTEGAALASAILEYLAHGGAAITYVTTHHAELKELASRDNAFVDASVEFNVATLLPTYKILWGKSGQSHALAVAEGLGFDPQVIKDASTIASNLKESSRSKFLHMESIRESLPSQLRSAENDLMQARKQYVLADKQLQEAQNRCMQMQQDLEQKDTPSTDNRGKVYEEINKIIQDTKAGSLSVTEADQALRGIANTARVSAKSKAIEALEASFDDDSPNQNPPNHSNSGSQWMPEVGDTVLIVTMGGKVATVESVNPRKGKLTVRAGILSMETSVSEIRPYKGSPLRTSGDSNKGTKRSEAQRDGSKGESQTTQHRGVAIQTSANTIDVRGESADDAVSTVKIAIGTAPSGSILFVIHGVGTTGRVRAAVLEYLRKEPMVVKVEQEPGSNGGCAIVYLS